MADVLGVSVNVPDLAELTFLDTSAESPVGTVVTDQPGPALTAVTGLALEHTELFCVHSGVVAGPAGLLAFPGFSGMGKTTLTAALLTYGFGYVSDEALALDRATGSVRHFARPLALDEGSRQLLGLEHRAPGEVLVDPATLGSIAPSSLPPLTHVLLVSRRPGPPTLATAPASAGLDALLRRSFNHFRDARSATQTAARVVRNAVTLRLEYENAVEAAQTLRDVLAE